MAIQSIPEVESVVGKIGRADTPLDPAPISMVEAVINYLARVLASTRTDIACVSSTTQTASSCAMTPGELIPDSHGRPYRQWRDSIHSADDIWNEIVKVAQIPGTTSAPKLQPIAARIVMLQSGMRAPMGIKVKGPDLQTIEDVGLKLERYPQDGALGASPRRCSPTVSWASPTWRSKSTAMTSPATACTCKTCRT